MSPFAWSYTRLLVSMMLFHVGVLKKLVGAPPATLPALPPIHHGAVVPEPLRVERARLARGVRQILVH